MKGRTRTSYLNTDLDLWSREDLRPLTRALDRTRLVFAIHVGKERNGEWRAILETFRCNFRAPGGAIAEILDAIECLKPAARERWSRCCRRDLNIGYECGGTPRRLEHGLPPRTLKRMASLGLSLRVTLYSHEPR